MPLKHDLAEAQEANDFLADVLSEKPQWVVGENAENTGQLITLCGDQLREDCMTKATRAKFGKILKDFGTNPAIQPLFEETYKGLKSLKQKRIDKAIENA